jgi:TetR/AcrR family acrAB operon transcriptional repressor
MALRSRERRQGRQILHVTKLVARFLFITTDWAEAEAAAIPSSYSFSRIDKNLIRFNNEYKFIHKSEDKLMPRTKEQFEEMRNATREKIQEAAMQLFVQKGFGSTNVQAIADLAGISIGLLYRHYKTKEQLFSELVEFSLAGIRAVTDLFGLDESPKKLIGQFVSEVYNDMITGEQLANLLILMSQSFFSGEANLKQNEIAELNGKMLHSTAELIKRGQELGEFRSGNPHEMAIYFYSAIHGLAEMKITLKDSFIMPSSSILTAFLYKEGE